MKYMKLVLVALLIFAVAAMTFGCPAPAVPDAGTTTTTTTSGSTGGNGGGGQQPEGGGSVEDNTPGQLYYAAINARDCEIIGFSGKFASGTVEIPATAKINGTTYNVKRIAAGAFKNCTSLTTIVIPDEITAIGVGAFEGCTKLTSITLPFVGSGTGTATGVELGSYFGYIFGGVSFAQNASVVPASLTTVTLSDACTKIADFAFDSCATISTVNLGANVESIGRYAFAGTAITEVSLPATVTSVGIGAYARCEIKNMTLPFVGADASAEIGYIGHLFGASSYLQNTTFVPASLTNVTVLDGCTTLGTGAFYGCANLESPTLPVDDIVSIGRYAFEGTAYYEAMESNKPVYIGKVFYTFKGTAPTSFTINNGTVSIAAGAFADTDITSVSIPKSVTHIGLGAFENTKLTSITLSFLGESADNAKYNYLGFIFGDATAAANGNSIPATLKTVILNDACVKVASRAFYGCDTIQTVTIGANVSEIAKDAFFACSSLKTITVDSANASFKVAGGLLYNKAGTELVGVPCAITGEITLLDITEIGESQFAGCTGITKINLPATLTSIAKDAFAGATNLTFSSFPSITYVGYNAFEGTAWYNAKANGLVQVGKVLYRVKGAKADVVVPAGVVYITEGAFEETNATSITLPTTVNSVGLGIFRNCTELTTLTIPFVGQNVLCTGNTMLGYMFGAETLSAVAEAIPASLTTITLLDGCTDLGNNAFYGCPNLATINFSANIVYIAGNALDSTAFLAAAAQDTENPFLYIGKVLYRFFAPADAAATDAIYDVVVKDGTVLIADNAFAGSLIRTVTMPDSTVTIGAGAFANCTKLTQARVSKELSSLGKAAFSGCTSLYGIYIPSTLKVISEAAFDGCSGMRMIFICRGVEKISVNAFNGCTRVQYLFYIVEDPDTDTSWNDIDIENQGSSRFNANVAFGTPEEWSEEEYNPVSPS